MDDSQIHALAFLLDFDGRVHWYEQGYFVKFEIKRIEPTEERPHGLRYSFTLHAPEGERLMGFDNAHTVAPASRYAKRQVEADHWHRDETDRGRPYVFTDAVTLIGDFFGEVERILTERGVPLDAVREGTIEERTKP
jgi:hypothetical protein